MGKRITTPAEGHKPRLTLSTQIRLAGWLLFVVLGPILCVGTLHVLTEGVRFRTVGRRNACQMQMRSIAIAMHEYHEVHGCLPPAHLTDGAGTPTHSWRVLLLPYLGREDLYRQYRFDEPWNGPNNRLLAQQMPSVYGCPSEKDWSPDTHRWTSWTTSYLVVVGPGTAFGREKSTIDAIGADKILLVETVDSGIQWMEPRDLDIDAMPFTINEARASGIGSRHFGNGANVALADCRVVFISSGIGRRQLRQLLTIGAGQ